MRSLSCCFLSVGPAAVVEAVSPASLCIWKSLSPIQISLCVVARLPFQVRKFGLGLELVPPLSL